MKARLLFVLVWSFLTCSASVGIGVACNISNASTEHLRGGYVDPCVWNVSELAQARWQRSHWSKHLGQSLETLLDTIKAKPPLLPDEDLRVFDMMGPVAQVCNKFEHYGEGDEEKRFCGDFNALRHPCVIFSIGSNNQWGFEEDIHRKTNCSVKTFDCTMRPGIVPPLHIQDRVQLLPYCLGPRDEVIGGRQFHRYHTLLNITGVVRPTAMKMDIEGWEWSVLPAVLNDASSGAALPEQISFELHYVTNNSGRGLSWFNRYKTPGEIAIFMDRLYHSGGYMLVDRRDNYVCMSCSEVVVARLTAHADIARSDETNFDLQHSFLRKK